MHFTVGNGLVRHAAAARWELPIRGRADGLSYAIPTCPFPAAVSCGL